MIDSYVDDIEEIQQKEETLGTVQLKHDAETAALKLVHEKESLVAETRNPSLQKRAMIFLTRQ